MFKKIIYLLIVVLTFTTIFILIYKKRVKQELHVEIGKRTIIEVGKANKESYNFDNPPYRLIAHKDSIIILVDTLIYILDSKLKINKIVSFPFENSSGIFYYKPITKGGVGFNFLENKLYVKVDSEMRSLKSNDQIINSIWVNNEFYTCTINKNQLVTINKWNPVNNSNKLVYNISEKLKDTLKSKDCILETLEGNFFAIDEQTLGFYFYRGDKFLVINSDSSILVNSIVKYPFIEFYKKKIKMADGSTLEPCEATKNIFVQMSACSDGSQIFILSSFSKNGQAIIDIYSKTGGYVKSLQLPKFGSKKMPTDILVIDKILYVVFDKNLFSYNINGLWKN